MKGYDLLLIDHKLDKIEELKQQGKVDEAREELKVWMMTYEPQEEDEGIGFLHRPIVEFGPTLKQISENAGVSEQTVRKIVREIRGMVTGLSEQALMKYPQHRSSLKFWFCIRCKHTHRKGSHAFMECLSFLVRA
jgi:hypothetical protein